MATMNQGFGNLEKKSGVGGAERNKKEGESPRRKAGDKLV